MGDLLTFPTHESTIADRLEALLEAAKEGVLVAFVYATMNQDGEHVYDILGEIDEPQMISTLNTLKREIKKLE